MKDLKFEHKKALSRIEAADQLAALAQALREGGEAELELGSGVLSLRIPDELRGEVEFEVGGGEIELEIELKWPTGRSRHAAAPAAGTTADAESERAPARSATKSAANKQSASPTPSRRTAAKRK
ncbi:amphi-Trp domain-containing protein [Streptomyces sp. NPDC052023]|uniref:amphi-Trp domain-containing protein n=1 Tax=Streptomyces sp. NPDC052023 TaxID=3365681 RepID=UPI0037D5B98C